VPVAPGRLQQLMLRLLLLSLLLLLPLLLLPWSRRTISRLPATTRMRN